MKEGVILKALIQEETLMLRKKHLVLSCRPVPGKGTCLSVTVNERTPILKNFKNEELEEAKDFFHRQLAYMTKQNQS